MPRPARGMPWLPLIPRPPASRVRPHLVRGFAALLPPPRAAPEPLSTLPCRALTIAFLALGAVGAIVVLTAVFDYKVELPLRQSRGLSVEAGPWSLGGDPLSLRNVPTEPGCGTTDPERGPIEPQTAPSEPQREPSETGSKSMESNGGPATPERGATEPPLQVEIIIQETIFIDLIQPLPWSPKSSPARAPTTHSTVRTPTTHLTARTPTTHSTARTPTIHSTVRTPTTHSTARTPTIHSTARTPTTHSTPRTPTTHSTARSTARISNIHPTTSTTSTTHPTTSTTSTANPSTSTTGPLDNCTDLPTSSNPTNVSDARDCYDVMMADPSATSGVRKLVYGFYVYCDMGTLGGGWTIIQRRLDDIQSFNQPWSAYVKGFGAITDDFWLGLENIAAMLAGRRYYLRVEFANTVIRSDAQPDRTNYAALYSNFSIGSAADLYRLLSVGEFCGSPGTVNGLAQDVGAAFSTYDENNSGDSTNCAEVHSSGWWFTSTCGGTDPNDNSPYNEDYWNYKEYDVLTTLLPSQMKIRPCSECSFQGNFNNY